MILLYYQAMSLLDFFFPKYCVACRKLGSYLCSSCFAYLSFSVTYVCAICNRASLDGQTHPVCRKKYSIDGILASIVYEKTAKKLLYVFKYRPYVTAISSLLVDLFFEGLIQNEIFNLLLKEQPLLVPIPLHSGKLRRRGYNQAELLAKGLGLKTNLAVVNLLQRLKMTNSQFWLSKEQREENLQGVFALSQEKKERVMGRMIFLVDDITTTGTTFQEAANVLKRNGAKKVFGLALARGG